MVMPPCLAASFSRQVQTACQSPSSCPLLDDGVAEAHKKQALAMPAAIEAAEQPRLMSACGH